MVEFPIIIPYCEGNLGKAYNDAMKKVDDWVLFLDYDILVLRPNFYEICQQAIEAYPDAGWVSGVTNRIWDPAQKKAPEKDHDDLKGHIKHSNDLYERYGNQVIEHSSNRPMSGFFILTNKKAWEDVGGFKDGILSVDNDYYYKLIAKNYKCYIIPGLYCYHLQKKKKYYSNNKPATFVLNKTKIGVSMIMKDEAENLPRCLESLKDFADEVVILDTGSTDDSVEIAKSYGAKVIVPEHLEQFFVETQFGHKINFSEARNECLRYLSDDTNWVFQVDCDEELEVHSTKDEIMLFLESIRSDVNGITIDMKNMSRGKMDCQFLAPRIFRKDRINYKNIVHNRPDVDGNIWSYINQDKTRLALKHYGYDLSEDKKKEKNERTIGLLHKRIEDNPEDYETYFYLSQGYGWGVDEEKSIEYGIKYVEKRDQIIAKNLSFNDAVFYTLAAKLIQAERYQEAGKWIKLGLELDKNNLDLHYCMVRLGLGIKEVKLIIHGAEGFLKTYGNYEQFRLTQGTRFVYNYNSASCAFCTLHLTLSMFQQGAFLKHQFEEILKDLPEGDSGQFLQAFKNGLQIIGFEQRN